MKNIDLAKKIKELRTRKGFSQDELATTAQINLRTVQRIESGETEPRGDTLQRLAGALNVTADELIDWAEQEDNNYLMLLNLSAFSFIAFPLLGVIVPLVLWILKRDKIKGVNDTAKSLLNFQITWCILVLLFYSYFIALVVIKINHIPRFLNMDMIFIVALPTLYVVNGLLITVNAWLSYKGKKVFYVLAIPFLR